MATDYGGTHQTARREVFVSYHHGGDQNYYEDFSAAFDHVLQLISDNSLERRVNSGDPAYIMRRIREHHLHGSSCTIVLCGADTWRRRYVDWEIKASLDQKMALVGIWLPTLPLIGNGTEKPARLQDNIDSGYAIWTSWDDVMGNNGMLARIIERALASRRSAIANDRPMLARDL